MIARTLAGKQGLRQVSPAIADADDYPQRRSLDEAGKPETAARIGNSADASTNIYHFIIYSTGSIFALRVYF